MAAYAAPEVLRSGPEGVGPAADVYSLAMLMFTMAAGIVPHAHLTVGKRQRQGGAAWAAEAAAGRGGRGSSSWRGGWGCVGGGGEVEGKGGAVGRAREAAWGRTKSVHRPATACGYARACVLRRCCAPTPTTSHSLACFPAP